MFKLIAQRVSYTRDNQSNEDTEGGTQETRNSSILKDFSVAGFKANQSIPVTQKLKKFVTI